jgi:hypothetical protein
VLVIMSCDSRGVSSLENALGGSPFAVLGAGLSGAREESVLEYVVDDASAVLAWETKQSKLSGTRVFAVLVDMIDYASGNSRLGDVTWTGGSYGTYSVSMLGEAHDVSAISLLGGVMIGMSAETVLGVEISDANADIGQESTECDSRRASSSEDVTDIISRSSVLGTALDGTNRLSVSGDVIINANSVFVWRNKHDDTRANALLGDVTDCASGEYALGNVTSTGGTSSVSVMGDLLDISAITVLGGHVMADTSAATVLRCAMSDANARARLKQRMSDDSRRASRPKNMIRSPISAGAGLGGASGASVSADVIDGTSSALVWKNVHDGTREATVLGTVIACVSGESVLGNVTLTCCTSSVSIDLADVVPVPGDQSDVERVMSATRMGTVIVDTRTASAMRNLECHGGAVTLSGFGDVIGGAMTVPTCGDVIDSLCAISALSIVTNGMTNDVNGITMSVRGCTCGDMSAVSELARRTVAAASKSGDSGLRDVIGGTIIASFLEVVIGNESAMSELCDMLNGIRSKIAVSAVTVSGVVINNASVLSNLLCMICRATTVPVPMFRIPLSMPPFCANGYTESESVPESDRSESMFISHESESVRSVQKQRGRCYSEPDTMSKIQSTEKPSSNMKPDQVLGESAGPELALSVQVENLSSQLTSAGSNQVYAGPEPSGSVIDDQFAMLPQPISAGSLICQCHQNQCQCLPGLCQLSACQPELESVPEAKLSDFKSTLITAAQGGGSSSCCSTCLVSAGPTQNTGLQISRFSSRTPPWRQSLLTISWLDCSSVWMLKVVLLLFWLYLFWLYGTSYSTTTHSLMTCSFSLHCITIQEKANGSVGSRGGLSCYDLEALRCDILFGSTVDDEINNGFDGNSSQTVSEMNENKGSFVLRSGIASRLFINNLLQVRVDGLDLCGQDTCISPFGYYCTVSAVPPPLPSAKFKSQLARYWSMQKGADKKQHPSPVNYLPNMEETDRGSKQLVKKIARKSCEQTSLLKVISHIRAALLVLITNAFHNLNIVSRSTCWVSGNHEDSRRLDDGFCSRVIISEITCGYIDGSGISDSSGSIYYDRPDHGANVRKNLHYGNSATGTHGSFDTDDPGRSCNRKRKRRPV